MEAAIIPRGAGSVMASRSEPHDSLDFFPTPPWATRALCELLIPAGPLPLKEKRAWDPACGQGHMARPMSEYFGVVYSSDVHDYGAGAVLDFLFPYQGPPFDWIITNPPFRLAEQFAHAMIDRAVDGAAILVRTAFLESVGRYRALFAARPPAAILQFTERVPMFRGRTDEKGSTATAYCWIVWRCRPHKPAPMDTTAFYWVPPCRRQLKRPGDYAEVAA
jgi:hypothetical protein